MWSLSLLQTSTGGSPVIVALTLLGLLATVLLSLAVAYLVVRGYRRNRDRARLFLAIGLLFLTTGPIVLQFVLTNVTTLSPGIRSATANASKLVGLASILYAIYGGTRPPKNQPSSHDEGREHDPSRSDEVDS
ncbi:DUF7521 family protein [Haloprofundus salilacus]|uniref:DUF7521 family protein n=1 Tax=Haloprofundus salilacus TaxID=2876190 RepID=UPI001CCA20E9|nr:DUF5985 family protein [Haloprofundus salilacus]